MPLPTFSHLSPEKKDLVQFKLNPQKKTPKKKFKRSCAIQIADRGMYLGQGRGRSSASQIKKLAYNADEENKEGPNQDCRRNNNRCQST